jgi:beta-glucosidase
MRLSLLAGPRLAAGQAHSSSLEKAACGAFSDCDFVATGRRVNDRSAASSASAFPPSFLWGTATASHQVEGNNRWNDWWPLEEAGRLPYRSGEACRQFELYEQDFDLVRSWGHNALRFSLEWSRIEPRQGEWDMAAVEHYARVIRALRERGIEPLVTLHHFTNPQWFAERGGWVAAGSVALFRRYAEFIARQYSGLVRYWITVNEPTVYAKHAYVTGDWPPLRKGAWLQSARAQLNLYRAHCVAYRALHAARKDVMVGLAHSAPHVVPCRPDRWVDRMSARLRDFVLNDAPFASLRLLAGRPYDFIGINYYARQVVRWKLKGMSTLFGVECHEDHHGEPRHFSALGWEVYSPGLRQVLEKFAAHGVPLIVSENGIATEDEDERTEFVRRHLATLGETLRGGTPVLGYFYWSLMDNYEWAAGFRPRFGLAGVDFTTQARHARPAAKLLTDTIWQSRACATSHSAAAAADILPGTREGDNNI